MSYVDDSLVPGETVIYRARVHWAVFLMPVIFSVLFTYLAGKVHQLFGLAIFLVFIFLLLELAATFFSIEFALTNKRIIAKRGLIRRRSIEMMLSKVESLTVSQGLNGRIWGYGTVVVAGSGGTRQSFPMIGEPMELRKRVNIQIAANN